MNVQTSHQEQGSALLEALIGILIFSMGILAIVGLQAASIKNTADSKDRTDASFIASQEIAKMWVDQGNLAGHVVTNKPITGLPDGKVTIELSGTLATVTITWQPPNSAVAHRFVSASQITSN